MLTYRGRFLIRVFISIFFISLIISNIYLLATSTITSYDKSNETKQTILRKNENNRKIKKHSQFQNTSLVENRFLFSLRPWLSETSIESEKTCSDKNVVRWSMVFVIKSAVGNFELRRVIRKTWGKVKVFEDVKFEYVFLVGKSNEDVVASEVIAENSIYGDILQFNWLESAKNVPEKVLAGMQWASALPNNWLYASIDDDFIIHHDRLVSYFNRLLRNFTKENLEVTFEEIPLVCVYSYQENDPPSRKVESKWYVSLLDYPSPYWPTYCRGGMYTVNVAMVKKLFEVSKDIFRLQMEDVWITGLMRLLTDKRNSSIVPASGSLLSDEDLHSTIWSNSTIVFHLWGNIEGHEVDVSHLMKREWENIFSSLKEKINCF